MQMLQQRSARSQLPMSNVARRHLGITTEQPFTNKNQHLPSHYFHIGQEVMHQNPITMRWFPTSIKALCPEPKSYHIETLEGVTYRRTQNHLKPYKSHPETSRREQSIQEHSNMIQTSVNVSDNTNQLHPKRQIKRPVKLNL